MQLQLKLKPGTSCMLETSLHLSRKAMTKSTINKLKRAGRNMLNIGLMFYQGKKPSCHFDRKVITKIYCCRYKGVPNGVTFHRVKSLWLWRTSGCGCCAYSSLLPNIYILIVLSLWACPVSAYIPASCIYILKWALLRIGKGRSHKNKMKGEGITILFSCIFLIQQMKTT
jgi:hypothetical protein